MQNDRSDVVVSNGDARAQRIGIAAMASMPNATMPECDNPGLAAGRLRTAPRPGYAPTLL